MFQADILFVQAYKNHPNGSMAVWEAKVLPKKAQLDPRQGISSSMFTEIIAILYSIKCSIYNIF